MGAMSHFWGFISFVGSLLVFGSAEKAAYASVSASVVLVPAGEFLLSQVVVVLHLVECCFAAAAGPTSLVVSDAEVWAPLP